MSRDSVRYLNVRETAARFQVHENTIRNWVRSGILQSSRLPGSRFHRFDEREVVRLLRQRRAAEPSVQAARSTIGPELVDAPQLDQWASTPDAPHRFPELMRRLLAATPGVMNVSMRAGSGVAISGWDGRAESSGTPFLPAGRLYFELSVANRPKSKADENWKKRRDDPCGAVPAESVFVFVTPKRWGGAASWAVERKREGVFADVLVLDADDLEGWLRETPQVHHWISEQLGRRPEGAETWERWWARFREQTKPELPPALFLAGREEGRAQLLDFFARPPGVLVVEAPWRDDALAFVCAAIEAIEPAASAPQALIVHSREVWDRIIQEPGPMTLIPLFDKPGIAVAERRGHSLIVPLDRERGRTLSGPDIKLPPPHRGAATAALEASGLDLETSNRLAALARRSMPALIRELSVDPLFNHPPWSQPPDSAIVIPLVLLGAWTSAESDREIASRIASQEWDQIERTLRRWQSAADPPFIPSAKAWRLASPEEAFLVARDQFTASDLQRWHEVALVVLLELDPRLELSPGRRPYALLDGIARRYSSELRRGIAQGIAVLGAMEDERLADGKTGAEHARALVYELLQEANSDETGRTWASLSDVLPLLAEAAPAELLDAVNTDLSRPESLLKSMFRDGHEVAGLVESPHTGLLWALETICWSPDWIVQGCLALARLQQIDPGGYLANRPLASLSNILLGWIRNTGAPLDQRVRALESVCQHVPVVGWKVLLEVWPSGHSFSTPPATPRFRHWRPEASTVTLGDHLVYIGHLVRLAIDLAGEDPLRWADLAEHLEPLPPDERRRVLEFLEKATGSSALTAEQRVKLWERLRRAVALHRRARDTGDSEENDWLARLERLTNRLEPADRIERFGYLFEGHPMLADVDLRDFAAHEARLRESREEAVRKALTDGTLSGLSRLARHVADAYQLGSTAADLADAELSEMVLEWLDSPDEKLSQMARGWAARKLFDRDSGPSWLRRVIELPDMQSASRRLELAKLAPATRQIWETLEKADAELARTYWREARFFHVPAADAGYAVRSLLDHGRAWAAIDVLASAIHGLPEDAGEVPPEIVERALTQAVSSGPGAEDRSTRAYEVSILLDHLEAQGTDVETLASLELEYFNLIERHRGPKTLYALLASDPSRFVELASRVYRGTNEPKSRLGEEEARYARHAWRVLHCWEKLPGLHADGTIDIPHLNSWVDQARFAFSDSDRADVGDEVIGQVLATSPPGSDGVWPAEPVREIVERIGSTHLESGLSTGRFNARGVTARGVYDGGQQERELAKQYREWSKETEVRYPRTSRLLRRLAESYEAFARRMDDEGETWADG
jgi:hypothetical protein